MYELILGRNVFFELKFEEFIRLLAFGFEGQIIYLLGMS